MPPSSNGEDVRTVGCALTKLIPNPVHLQKIRDAVATTHKATILATELLNMHIRRTLEFDPAADLSCCFNANWPWVEVEEAMGKRIRGLRRCTQRGCMIPLIRATNIGTNFARLMADRPLIRSMTDEDLAFHHASLCLECD